MIPNYKGKLQAIMWMGLGAAILSSIFSAFIIKYVVEIKKKINQLSNS